MARVPGTVVAVRDGRAWIECSTEPAACGACADGRGCGWFRRVGSRRLETSDCLDGTRLTPGEVVELEADEQGLLAAAARLYLPLLAGLLLGPSLARWAGLDGGLLPLLAAVIGLAGGALVARALTRGGAPVRLRRP